MFEKNLIRRNLAPLMALMALMALVVVFPAAADEATPMFQDTQYESRFNDLSKELRCVKCQNQSLADSPAGIASDLRREVHEKMREGMTDQEIVDFLVSKYGDYIRYRPEFKPSTYLLWIGPFLLLAGGLAALYFNLSKRRQVVDESSPLSDVEREQVTALLKADEAEGDSKA